MGLEGESFVGNPNKQEYLDEDEELDYLSVDEVEFDVLGLPLGDPYYLEADNYDSMTDNDDDDYDPMDDYEDFLSDSDYDYHDEATGSDGSTLEHVDFPNFEVIEPNAVENNQESSDKGSGDNKTIENTITDDVKTSNIDSVDSGEADVDVM